MVVIKVEPWDQSTSRPPSKEGTVVKELEMFGFQDLASDYYQVLRQSSRPRWCRFVWGFVILVLLIFTGFMVYQLLSDYLAYNSYIESHIKWQHNVTLPAITICNTNPLNYTALRDKLTNDDQTHLLEEFEWLMYEYIRTGSVEGGYEYLNMSSVEEFNMWEHTEGSLVLQFKPHLYNMLFGRYDYSFRGIGYYINGTEWSNYAQMTELGVCFELNDDGALTQNTGGLKGGLVVDLDANVADYLFTTHTKGFVVFIRDQDETIMLDRGGYIVAPGSESFLKLSKYSNDRLREPHGTCENVPSKFAKYTGHYESVRECVQRQRMDALVSMCNCIPWYLAERLYTLNKTDVLDEYAKEVRSHEHDDPPPNPRPNRDTETAPPTPTSNFTTRHTSEEPTTTQMWTYTTETPFKKTDYMQLTCGFVEMLICEQQLAAAEVSGEIQFNPCPEPCKYNEWTVEIASTVFPPTEDYFERFIKDSVYTETPPTYDYIKENMARIHIYYDELKIMNQVQTKAYEPQNFIAEFGGTVDLFIGFSFFTVFQLIEIAIAMCLSKLWEARKKSARRSKRNRSRSTASENSGEVYANTAATPAGSHNL